MPRGPGGRFSNNKKEEEDEEVEKSSSSAFGHLGNSSGKRALRPLTIPKGRTKLQEEDEEDEDEVWDSQDPHELSSPRVTMGCVY